MKSRSFYRLPLQLVKTIIFQTTVRRRDLVADPSRDYRRIGIAVTYNQFVALSNYCDLVVCLDRRAFDREFGASIETKFRLAFLPRYIFEAFKTAIQCLRNDRSLLRYIDIIARQNCLDHEELRALIAKSKKPVYVSNLNNPLIIYIKSVLKDRVKWAHVPHATLGNTILPELSFVCLYVASDEFERDRLKEAGWGARLYVRKQSDCRPFKSSKTGHYFLLLPKNYWDVNVAEFSGIVDASFTVKFHPSSLSPLKEFWKIWFFVKTGSVVTETRSLRTDSRVFSASSSVVYAVLREGKCVYMLPMRSRSLDHYGFDHKLFEFSRPETKANFEEQKREILIDE